MTLNLHGDTVWLRGRVASKEIKDDLHTVECEFWGENQRGEMSLRGTATVCLPWWSQGVTMFTKVPLPLSTR